MIAVDEAETPCQYGRIEEMGQGEFDYNNIRTGLSEAQA